MMGRLFRTITNRAFRLREIGILLLGMLILTTVTTGILSTTVYPVSASPSSAAWCGKLSSYTTWHQLKPVIFVWKGKGRGNPYNVSIKYNGKSVPNTGAGVQTSTGPQVDKNDGWVGYYISKRFIASTASNWDDDNRWEVKGCLP